MIGVTGESLNSNARSIASVWWFGLHNYYFDITIRLGFRECASGGKLTENN